MNKYKIVKCASSKTEYTLHRFEEQTDCNTILVFEAKTEDEARFIKNQFLHFEPYKPFGEFWIAEVGHNITIAGKTKSKHNYECRTLLVLAENEVDAHQKILKEVEGYSRPYKNEKGEDVSWKFDKIITLQQADFFDTIDLYRGIPVEIKHKVITKKKSY